MESAELEFGNVDEALAEVADLIAETEATSTPDDSGGVLVKLMVQLSLTT